jgi:hypothetical protein
MKKAVLLVLLAWGLFSVTAFAEELQKKEMPTGPMRGMGKMCPMMMGKSQMVATDEGGVIVLAGNKLMKYDADLNLVKDVEVKMAPSSMMASQCPMSGNMKGNEVAPEKGNSGMVV